jgi:hypothetical protein
MPRIVETIVTTLNQKGEAHIAPLGLIDDAGTGWIVAPFRPSRTLDNLMSNPFVVASHTDDVRVFAGCITGRREWPLLKADIVNGVRLENAVSHWELKVDRLTDHEQRPRFHCQIVHSGSHRPWPGYNRAQAAVLELAVLSTRLGMLPPEKVESELKYLQIAIDKTAGERELEAWGWLMARIDAWRHGDDKATKKI